VNKDVKYQVDKTTGKFKTKYESTMFNHKFLNEYYKGHNNEMLTCNHCLLSNHSVMGPLAPANPIRLFVPCLLKKQLRHYGKKNGQKS